MKKKLKEKNIQTPILPATYVQRSAASSLSVPSTIKRSSLKKISLNVPVEITEKVQNQIYILCNRIHDVEWSGTLFYTTEGEFGEENFKIKTEEIYLQDIGSSSYTEYDPSNPEFIQFLMKRPDLMSMRSGHIHSH